MRIGRVLSRAVAPPPTAARAVEGRGEALGGERRAVGGREGRGDAMGDRFGSGDRREPGWMTSGCGGRGAAAASRALAGRRGESILVASRRASGVICTVPKRPPLGLNSLAECGRAST